MSLRSRTPETLARARALVLMHGWNTTTYQILNPGFEYWFDPAGDAVAGVVATRRTWVVAGAPVCTGDRLAAVAEQLERAAQAAGARVCYVAAQRRLERVRRGAPGTTTVRLGAEPFWDPGRWADQVDRHASLRAQFARARKKGVEVRELPATAPLPEAVRATQQRWLASKELPPLGFLTTPWLLDALKDRRVLVASRGEEVAGYAILTPVPGRAGWLAEQIVRSPTAPNGTAELLVDHAMRRLADERAAFLSLGIVPLSRRAEEQDDAPWWLRGLLAWVRAHGRRFYNFDGLDNFKAKFGPVDWEPVYAILGRPRVAPGLLWDVLTAVTGGSPAAFFAAAGIRAARAEWRRLRQ